MAEPDELKRGRGRRVLSGAATLLAVGCLASCAAWSVSGLGWAADLVAVFTAHWVVLAVAVGVLGAVVRSRVAVALTLVAVIVGGFGLVRGRTLVVSSVGNAPAPLRLLVFNAHALNQQRDACFELIADADADVVVLIEPEIEFSRALRWDRALEASHPQLAQRTWVKHTVSPIVVLSRLPMTEIDPGRPAEDERFLVAAQVEAAWGPVVIAAGQPRSPRNAARWAAGNAEARLHAGLAAEIAARGVPFVWCGDLNSTPVGHRGAILRGAGLTPCKPLLTPTGTFPAALPWPARVALDDAWHSADVTPIAWRTVGPAGSDHMGVLVELVPAR